MHTLPSLIIIFGFLESAQKIQWGEVTSYYFLRNIIKLLIHQLSCKENIFVNNSAEKPLLQRLGQWSKKTPTKTNQSFPRKYFQKYSFMKFCPSLLLLNTFNKYIFKSLKRLKKSKKS